MGLRHEGFEFFVEEVERFESAPVFLVFWGSFRLGVPYVRFGAVHVGVESIEGSVLMMIPIQLPY